MRITEPNMNIEGLDYNTQREHLVLREYGRTVQNMVDQAIEIPDRRERQRRANEIINIMERMFPHQQGQQDYRAKLWDQLAIMSNFRLDVDYPFDVSNAKKISEKPAKVPYSTARIPVRHYGNMVMKTFEILKTMPEGNEYNELVRLTANQMKRDLAQWGHGSTDDEKVADDLARFTDGRVQLDTRSFVFEKNEQKSSDKRRRRK